MRGYPRSTHDAAVVLVTAMSETGCDISAPVIVTAIRSWSAPHLRGGGSFGDFVPACDD
jgi:hypothetical protein